MSIFNEEYKRIKMSSYGLLLLGVLLVIVSFLPAIILDANSIVSIHDQLDGEVLVYMLRSKDVFAPAYESFMNGMPSTSQMPASWGSLLFYWLLPPFAAYLLNYIFVAVAAYMSMYLLLDKLLHHQWIASITAFLYAQLPFYPVYGLSVMGQPLLIYACVCILRNEKPAKAYLAVGIFSAFTSLFLIGYADILCVGLFCMLLMLRKHPSAKKGWIMFAILVCMLAVPNWQFIQQIFSTEGMISHRTEWALNTSPFMTSFRQMYSEGHYHAESLHNNIIPWAQSIMCSGVVLFYFFTREEKKQFLAFASFMASILAVAAIYSLWHCEHVVNIRRSLGGMLTSFQADRFYWFNPALWFIVLAYVVWFLWTVPKRMIVLRIISCVLIAALLKSIGMTVYDHSFFKTNFYELAHYDSHSKTTWSDFFSPDLFADIQDYIGLPQNEYRVASVALYPSVPLYNGFYCIDGYSNNYSLEYKHAFREIITKELEKNVNIADYFDTWGSRCYIFSADLGKSFFFTKDNQPTISIDLSHDALVRLGCDYIISGVKINNALDSGLLFEKTFEHPNSPYRIYLYKVTNS